MMERLSVKELDSLRTALAVTAARHERVLALQREMAETASAIREVIEQSRALLAKVDAALAAAHEETR